MTVDPTSLELRVPSPPTSTRVATSLEVTSAPAAPRLLYRLQATAPGRYAVSPAAGVLRPGVTVMLRVVLRAAAVAEASAAAVAAAEAAEAAETAEAVGGRRRGEAAGSAGPPPTGGAGLVDKFLLQVVAAPPLVVSAEPAAAEVRAAWPAGSGSAAGVRIPCLLRPVVAAPLPPPLRRPPRPPTAVGAAASAAAAARDGRAPPGTPPSEGPSGSPRRGRAPGTPPPGGSPPGRPAGATADSGGDLVAASSPVLAFPPPTRGRSTLTWTLASRHPVATLLVKVATNAPARYTVAPNVVTLRPGHAVTVVVHRAVEDSRGDSASQGRGSRGDRLQLVAGVLSRPPPGPLSPAAALAAHRRLPVTALRRQKHRCTFAEGPPAQVASWEGRRGRHSSRVPPPPRRELTSASSGGSSGPSTGRSASLDGGAPAGDTPPAEDPLEDDAWAWREPWAVAACTGGGGGGSPVREDSRGGSAGWRVG